MDTTIQTRPMTAEELSQLPTGMGVRYELIEGELIEMSPAGTRHGEVAANIIMLLGAFVKTKKARKVLSSETGFQISSNPDTVRAPDVAFIPSERIPDEGLPAGFCPIIPALIVEVISPSETATMVQSKTQMWLDFGVSQVWNVDPELRQVQVFEPQENGGKYKIYREDAVLTGGDILPGFELPIREIFPE